MVTSRSIRQGLLAKMPHRTMYDRMKAIKKKTGNSISNEVALDILASQEGIEVYDILAREDRRMEIAEFRDALSKFDFNEHVAAKKRTNNSSEQKEERSPYDIPLARYDLDEELIRDCKIQHPYRKAVSEALLTLETRIREKLGLPDDCIGVALIDEAQKRDIFKRSVQSEALGLAMLYRGGIMWLRNPAGHRKIEYSKEDALKIVLFSDYLIKLFEDLVKVAADK